MYPLANVDKAYALLLLPCKTRLQTGPVVDNLDFEKPSYQPCADVDSARSDPPSDSVTNRVLYQRLKYQIGDQNGFRVRIYLNLNAQPVVKPNLLDFEVTA